MKLKKVRILGIISYAGETEMHFSNDDNKPITVFHGENGAGKTSTLNAILWCLTGRLSAKLSEDIGTDPAKFFNRDMKEEDTPFVEIDFEFGGDQFKARRDGQLTDLRGNFSLKVLREGVWDSYGGSSEATMTNILPASIARYFIFDGEGFQAKGLGDSSVATAVKTILGFDHVESAIARMEDVKRQKDKEGARLEAVFIKDKRKKASYERAVQELESEKNRYSELAEELKLKTEELKDVEGLIGNLNIERVNALRKDEKRADNEITKLNNDVTFYGSQQLDLISKYYRSAFGAELFTAGLGVIDEKREKGVIPGKYNRQLIEDLKQAGECICGRCIDEEVEKILDSKSKEGFTSGLQERLTDAGACKKDDQIKLGNFRTEHSKLMAGINEARKNAKSESDRLKEIRQGLDEFENHEVRLAELRNQEVRIKARIATINTDMTSIQERINEHNHTRRTYAPSSVDTSEEQKKISRDAEMLESVVEYARSELAREFAYTKDFISREMNEFISGTNIVYGVTVDDSFKFSYRDVRGMPVLGSTGERKTLEFAFLSSLMKLVQEKSGNDVEGLLKPGSRIPIVLDAPFSELAENYISYISDMLLSVCDQLSVLMFNKDWKAFEEACDDKIGKEYVLVKNLKSRENGNLPVKQEFGGREFECVVYGAPRDCTTLEEVR